MNRRMIHLFLLTGLVLSCSPEVRHPDLNVVKTDNWQEKSAQYAAIDSAWWTVFNDIKLDSVIASAFAHNYNLKAAAARIEAAEAQATIAGADLFPSLSIGADASRREQSLVTFPPQIRSAIKNPVNTFGVSANIGWEIDLWGKARNARSAAVASFEASQADYRGFRLSLTAQTIKAWFAAIDAKLQLDLSEANYQSYQLTQDRIKERYRSGIRPSLDYRLSRSSVAAAQSSMHQRLQQSEQSRRQVELILGKYPAAAIGITEQLPAITDDIPAGIPADLLQRRPDIVAAERRLAAARCNVSAAKAALFPSIQLTGSAGTSTTELEDILNMDFSIWSIAGKVLQPVFQGGRLRANVRLNEALQKQAFATYADVVLKSYAEVEFILSAEAHLKKQEQATQVARDEAVAARQLAEDRYYKGLADIMTMLDARRQANDAESRLLSIRRQRLENRVDFYIAMGGSPETKTE